MDSMPFYHMCALRGYGECEGRITWEHAIIFAARQLNLLWAIVPLCERHHGVGRWMDAGTLDKNRNVWVALNRATEEELRAVSKAKDWLRERARLNAIYGPYKAI